MGEYIDKPEHKSTYSNNKKGTQSIQFKDRRVGNSEQINIQNTIDSSPRVAAQRAKTDAISNAPIQKKENNTGLPDQLKSGIESLSGLDMSDTRVHYNSSKPAQLQAHAYAQGTDIHLASGQEKHLPHEAWHVVQQKQGRVQATTQLKGKTLINDDAGLEREADVMGAKALQVQPGKSRAVQKKSITSSSKAIQRYSVVKEDGGKVYNKSTNGQFLVGIGYPNHELYIKDESILEGLNSRLEAGLLKFVSKGKHTFKFNQSNSDYIKVLPEHKNSGVNNVDEEPLYKGVKNVLTENLAKEESKQKHGKQFEKAKFNSGFNLQEKMKEYTTNTEGSVNVYEFKMKAEFVRKSLSQLGYTHEENHTIGDIKQAYIKTYGDINSYFNGGENKTGVSKSLSLFKTSLDIKSDNPIIEKIEEKVDEMIKFVALLPDKSDKILVKKGHLNHQFQQIESGNLLIPRGCDLVAGTTMGKATDEQSETPYSMRFIMNSNSEKNDDHKHFATKLLADGKDFVTIEGFAASGLNIFDNTWEIFLHGNRDKDVDAFNDYTMSRYDFFDFKKDYMERLKTLDLSDKMPRAQSTFNFMEMGVTKKLDEQQAFESLRFYNDHINAGGGKGKLKTKVQLDKDAYQLLQGKMIPKVVEIINKIPVNVNGVNDGGYEALKNQGIVDILRKFEKTDRAQGIAEYKLMFKALMNKKFNNHEASLLSIMNSKNYIKNGVKSTSITLDAKAQDMINACDTHIANKGKLKKKIAKSKKSEILLLKNKCNDLISYKNNHLFELDGIT